MAGIDKTYVRTWEDYKAAYDWALSVGTVTDDFGNVFAPFDWMAEYEESEFKESIEAQKERYRNYYKDPEHVRQAKDALGEDWEPDKEGIGELTLWNTPTYFDIWLIRNCPIDFIQGRLKQQYVSSYDELKERRSEYDTYVRPAASKHFKVLPLSSFPRIRGRNLTLYIQSEDSDWMYNDETRKWHHWLECKEWNTNTMNARGPITRRKLKRIILKCGFPAGVRLRVCSNYGHVFEVVIKK
jgi:hypothetical protein